MLSGSLNLEIESGRWRGITHENSIYKLCNTEIEDEIHFILKCPKLEHVRTMYKAKIMQLGSDHLTSQDRYIQLMNIEGCNVRTVSKFVYKLYVERKSILYN